MIIEKKCQPQITVTELKYMEKWQDSIIQTTKVFYYSKHLHFHVSLGNCVYILDHLTLKRCIVTIFLFVTAQKKLYLPKTPNFYGIISNLVKLQHYKCRSLWIQMNRNLSVFKIINPKTSPIRAAHILNHFIFFYNFPGFPKS